MAPAQAGGVRKDQSASRVIRAHSTLRKRPIGQFGHGCRIRLLGNQHEPGAGTGDKANDANKGQA